ncbi:MAG TPA: glycoside hydrolase family 38 C-terminal domain-containing protein, partial [Bacillota bacterium]|nr:glycoside hydrolase family 38 C-terminal domain-containing protein [Bacillota bacterium]
MFNEKYVIENIRRSLMMVKSRIYDKLCDLDMEIYKSKEPLSYKMRKTGEYSRVKPGDKWGDLFDCAWFHCTAVVPEKAKGKKVVYVIDINGEGLIYDSDGCPERGITNINSEFDRAMGNPGKRIVQYKDKADGGEKVDFWMDAGCNDLFGKLRENGTVKEAYIATCDDLARDLFYDGIVLLTQAENASAQDPLRYEILDLLQKCHLILRDYTEEEYKQCLELTKERLSKTGGDSPALNLTAFGHAHLDLAWWWPIRETKRKGARTFATALDLLDRYDDYRFGASQPQLFQWIKEDYPELYGKVKEAVKDGRWELLGAVWVEGDSNLVSGESLIRQILYGNAFWEKEFGQRTDFVWMPDTFGYTAAFPQIMKKSGIKYFSTIKLSWSLFNKFPYTNFHWRGLDGSEVLVHMPPEGNYLSEATAKSVAKIKNNIASTGQYGEALLPFGIGDGGGGPSPCHLEYLKRQKNLPGLCPIEQGTMADFFKRLDARSTDLPVWDGEMYLERHLGVFTSAARNKKYNRQMEFLLRDTEIFSALAMKLVGSAYPQEEIERIWKEVLLYQFHDILPGTSIKRVHDESLEAYAQLHKDGSKIRQGAAELLAETISTQGLKEPAVVFNTLSSSRAYWLETEKGYKKLSIPAMGYCAVDLDDIDIISKTEVKSESILENDYLRVAFLPDGSIGSIYHKDIARELLTEPSNLLLVYEDIPNAWNLDYDYRNQIPRRAQLTGCRFVKEGPAEKAIQTYSYGESSIQLTLTLLSDGDILDISADVDWKEKNSMLRVQFSPDVKTSEVISEIQFGHISRSTKKNNIYEKAQMEIPAHRWISLCEPGTNFALLNDCKYGFSVYDNVVEMNLLRGTQFPGVDLDKGAHTFRYGIYID